MSMVHLPSIRPEAIQAESQEFIRVATLMLRPLSKASSWATRPSRRSEWGLRLPTLQASTSLPSFNSNSWLYPTLQRTLKVWRLDTHLVTTMKTSSASISFTVLFKARVWTCTMNKRSQSWTSSSRMGRRSTTRVAIIRITRPSQTTIRMSIRVSMSSWWIRLTLDSTQPDRLSFPRQITLVDSTVASVTSCTSSLWIVVSSTHKNAIEHRRFRSKVQWMVTALICNSVVEV